MLTGVQTDTSWILTSSPVNHIVSLQSDDEYRLRLTEYRLRFTEYRLRFAVIIGLAISAATTTL